VLLVVVIVTAEGAQLYVCGWNGSGQLGIGNFNNVSVPSPISGLSQAIAKVSCGWNHTIAITSMCLYDCIKEQYYELLIAWMSLSMRMCVHVLVCVCVV